jgi:hypothetical protein
MLEAFGGDAPSRNRPPCLLPVQGLGTATQVEMWQFAANRPACPDHGNSDISIRKCKNRVENTDKFRSRPFYGYPKGRFWRSPTAYLASYEIKGLKDSKGWYDCFPVELCTSRRLQRTGQESYLARDEARCREDGHCTPHIHSWTLLERYISCSSMEPHSLTGQASKSAPNNAAMGRYPQERIGKQSNPATW